MRGQRRREAKPHNTHTPTWKLRSTRFRKQPIRTFEGLSHANTLTGAGTSSSVGSSANSAPASVHSSPSSAAVHSSSGCAQPARPGGGVYVGASKASTTRPATSSTGDGSHLRARPARTALNECFPS
jgi:hypothetical protein